MTSSYTYLNDVYRKMTTIVDTAYFFDNVFTAATYCTTPEEKEQLYKDVLFHVPGGRYLEVEPYSSYNAYIVSEAAKIIGINMVAYTDIDRDYDIDAVDNKIFSYATPETAYTLTFNNNGKGEEIRKEVTFKGNYKLTAKNLAYFKDVTDGDVTYTQTGWTDTATDGTSLIVGGSISNNTTAYAQWTSKNVETLAPEA